MNATGLDPNEATATATRYIVSYLDEDSPNYHMYAVAVEARGRGLWAIHRLRQCLGADGAWGPDTAPDEGKDQWLREHRFPLEEALGRARAAAALISVNGITVAEAKAKADQRRKQAGQLACQHRSPLEEALERARAAAARVGASIPRVSAAAAHISAPRRKPYPGPRAEQQISGDREREAQSATAPPPHEEGENPSE